MAVDIKDFNQETFEMLQDLATNEASSRELQAGQQGVSEAEAKESYRDLMTRAEGQSDDFVRAAKTFRKDALLAFENVDIDAGDKKLLEGQGRFSMPASASGTAAQWLANNGYKVSGETSGSWYNPVSWLGYESESSAVSVDDRLALLDGFSKMALAFRTLDSSSLEDVYSCFSDPDSIVGDKAVDTLVRIYHTTKSPEILDRVVSFIEGSDRVAQTNSCLFVKRLSTKQMPGRLPQPLVDCLLRQVNEGGMMTLAKTNLIGAYYHEARAEGGPITSDDAHKFALTSLADEDATMIWAARNEMDSQPNEAQRGLRSYALDQALQRDSSKVAESHWATQALSALASDAAGELAILAEIGLSTNQQTQALDGLYTAWKEAEGDDEVSLLIRDRAVQAHWEVFDREHPDAALCSMAAESLLEMYRRGADGWDPAVRELANYGLKNHRELSDSEFGPQKTAVLAAMTGIPTDSSVAIEVAVDELRSPQGEVRQQAYQLLLAQSQFLLDHDVAVIRHAQAALASQAQWLVDQGADASEIELMQQASDAYTLS